MCANFYRKKDVFLKKYFESSLLMVHFLDGKKKKKNKNKNINGAKKLKVKTCGHLFWKKKAVLSIHIRKKKKTT